MSLCVCLVQSSYDKNATDSFDLIIYDAANSVIAYHRTGMGGDAVDHIRIEKDSKMLNMIIPFSIRDRCQVSMITHPSSRDIMAGPLFALEAFLHTGNALFAPLMAERHDADLLSEIACALFDPKGPAVSLFRRPYLSSIMK